MLQSGSDTSILKDAVSEKIDSAREVMHNSGTHIARVFECAMVHFR